MMKKITQGHAGRRSYVLVLLGMTLLCGGAWAAGDALAAEQVLADGVAANATADVAIGPAVALPAPADGLAQVLAGSQRSDAARARDQFRHPTETLRFFGAHPGMTVVEIWPGKGWYTDILAPWLREKGVYYAAHFNPASSSAFFRDTRRDFIRHLAKRSDLFGKVNLSTFNPGGTEAIAPAGSADLVLTFRNVHNWYMRGGGEARVQAAFQTMFDALKPGGVLGVVEHRLPADRPLTDQEDSGYMREDVVVRAAEAAGFQLLASSAINANPLDTADHPAGVWTLPPTLRLGVQDREKYLAIGESDRMTLKFIKPVSILPAPAE